jgi:hypothetical protein
MSELTIKDVTKEVTAWSKEITFEREAETYLATLYWNIHDGYELIFKNDSAQTPEWAQEWIDTQDGDENLYEILDNLTEGEGESDE